MNASFLIIRPRKALSRVALNLVKDSGGKVTEKNCLGLVVECKKSIGQALDLIPIVKLEEVTRFE